MADKADLKSEPSCKSLKEKNDFGCSDRNLTKGDEHTTYILKRVLPRIESTLSGRRRLPYDEEDSGSYNNYIQKIVRLFEEKSSLIEDLYSGNYEKVFKAVRSFRILLSNSPNSPINEIIELGVLPKFVECLNCPERMLQFEASCLITNITYCSPLQTRFIIESGAVAALVKLLWTDCETVQTQAAWALGNIAGDEEEFRDYVISKGAIPGVVHVMKSTESDEMLLTCAWVLENLCTGHGPSSKLVQVLPVLQRFLNHDNSELVYKCLDVLACLTVDKELITQTVNCGMLPDILSLSSRTSNDVTLYILRIIANLSNTDDNNVKQNLLNFKILDHLSSLVQSSELSIRRQVCLTVYNITRSNKNHINTIISSYIFQFLLDNLHKEEDDEILKYTVGAIWNVMNLGSEEHVQYFRKTEIVKALCNTLSGSNDSVFHGVLCCLERLLEVGETEALPNGNINQVALDIEELEGLKSIELLLSHDSKDVYLKAFDLLERFFTDEEVNDNKSLEEIYGEFLFV